MKGTDYGKLFIAEEQVIEAAQAALDQGRIASGRSTEMFRWLLRKYTKLLRQTFRLIRFSDRMQNDLNQLNADLRRSESVYRNIFENAAEGIFRCLPSGHLIAVNPAMSRILGYFDPEAMMDENGGCRFLESQEGYQNMFVLVRQNGECLRFQTELHRQTGDTIWVEISARAFSSEAGKMMHIDGLLSDVTEQRLLHEELTRRAHTDELTGVFNRHYFMEKLKREIRQALRDGHPLALMMTDIDHFKSINDTFGHDVGDRVLRRVATTCCAALRRNDIFGRLGGEEFAVILPEITADAAGQIAERMRETVEAAEISEGGETIRVTISIGLRELGGGITEADPLLKAADTALYKAKQTGRNRVCCDVLPACADDDPET